MVSLVMALQSLLPAPFKDFRLAFNGIQETTLCSFERHLPNTLGLGGYLKEGT